MTMLRGLLVVLPRCFTVRRSLIWNLRELSNPIVNPSLSPDVSYPLGVQPDRIWSLELGIEEEIFSRDLASVDDQFRNMRQC